MASAPASVVPPPPPQSVQEHVHRWTDSCRDAFDSLSWVTFSTLAASLSNALRLFTMTPAFRVVLVVLLVDTLIACWLARRHVERSRKMLVTWRSFLLRFVEALRLVAIFVLTQIVLGDYMPTERVDLGEAIVGALTLVAAVVYVVNQLDFY
jgi:ABC-type iron transport system FetAB permease component